MKYTILLVVFFAGCMNMPTPVSQITAAHTTDAKYEHMTCDTLKAEYDSLSRREAQLVVAQQQRIKSSHMQGWLWGFGQGDGIEASELSMVKGEKEAVLRVMNKKGCLSEQPVAKTN